MAQADPVAPVAGQKRGPGRPPKTDTPVAKKAKLSTAVTTSPAPQSPSVSIAVEKRSSRLPSKLLDSKPLPTLPHPQTSTLSKDEYQSIAASAVLAASLLRSQAKWTCEGLFERYWVKPETGKNARPPPANNPDVKWMKHEGECRIRVEPHIFECQMYVERKPRPPPPPKQYVPSPAGSSTYGQPYRAPGVQQQQQQPYTPQSQAYQNRTLPPINQPQQNGRTLPPINSMDGHRTASAPSRTQAPSTPAQQDKKANPDPVISKLAARASSDPELKSLMKEVATGSATPEQLKVFQRHIDDLQKQIKEEKERKEREEEAERAKVAAQAKEEMIQYDGAGDTTAASTPPAATGGQYQQQQQPQQPQQPQQQQQQQHAPTYAPQPYAQPQYQQAQWTPPPPTEHPVIIGFSTPGASEDRFLFPRHSILEKLSDNHLLASFILTRKGRDAVDATGLDLSKEYWQPITLMVEVKIKLEPLLDHVRRWVKPAEEVRKYMQEVMGRCERAPQTHLALRLPAKGSAVAESEEQSKEATPIIVNESSAQKQKSSIKYVKKAAASSAKAGKSTPAATPTNKRASVGKAKTEGDAPAAKASAPPPEKGVETAKQATTDDAADGDHTNEGGRPRRAVRKSVRISEG